MKKNILIIGGTGLVGSALKKELEKAFVIRVASRNYEETKLRLDINDTKRLLTVLNAEKPDIVISSLRGDFEIQLNFHEKLADWVKENKRKLLYISTSNVFDGDLSKPHTENDPPCPESSYGIFKKNCEEMLAEKLGESLIIFRLASVWTKDCPRIERLKKYSQSSEPMTTYPNDIVNVTLAAQAGKYALYVLENDLSGIFHVATTDTADYFEFEKAVCKALKIKEPNFKAETPPEKIFYQTILPTRKEIPESLQLTVNDVLKELVTLTTNFG